MGRSSHHHARIAIGLGRPQGNGEATADLQTAFTRPANRLAERGRPPWQDAGSALLRNEAVHTVLTEPQGVSCLVSFAQKARG